LYCWPTIIGIIAFIYGCEFRFNSILKWNSASSKA
jgi:hypothetical protein